MAELPAAVSSTAQQLQLTATYSESGNLGERERWTTAVLSSPAQGLLQLRITTEQATVRNGQSSQVETFTSTYAIPAPAVLRFIQERGQAAETFLPTYSSTW